MFNNASNFVNGVDSAFMIITGISIFFLVVLTGLMIYFVIKYNKKKGKPAVQIKDNPWLEITWITIPMLLVLYMFYLGWKEFLPMRIVPEGALEITAMSSMWKYEFEYPGNKQSDTLVVPINKPIKVNLGSKDVLHGFSVPAFRIKEDMVPQKANYSWFTAGEYGEYDLYCTVYCGVSHTYMNSIVKVVSQEEFDKWLKALPEKKVDNSLGLKVLEKNGCIACHTIDGKTSVGPSFKGIYSKQSEVTSGGTTKKIVVDSAYIESSIYDPNKEIVVGYPQGVMKSYKGIITEKDLSQINEYLKSLK